MPLPFLEVFPASAKHVNDAHPCWMSLFLGMASCCPGFVSVSSLSLLIHGPSGREGLGKGDTPRFPVTQMQQ